LALDGGDFLVQVTTAKQLRRTIRKN